MLPSGNFFENRRQHGQSAGAEHRALRDLGNVGRLRNRDGEAVTRVELQHHVNIGAAVSRINYVIGTGDVLGEQLVEHRDLAVARGGANNRVDFAGRFVAELSAINVILGHDAFESGVNHLDGRGRENVKIEDESIHAPFEDLVKKFDIPLEANALAYLVKMFLAHLGFELRVVEKQVGEFGSLLDQVNLRHAFGFAFELRGGDADQLGEHVAGVVEGERLIEVACENIAF